MPSRRPTGSFGASRSCRGLPATSMRLGRPMPCPTRWLSSTCSPWLWRLAVEAWSVPCSPSPPRKPAGTACVRCGSTSSRATPPLLPSTLAAAMPRWAPGACTGRRQLEDAYAYGACAVGNGVFIAQRKNAFYFTVPRHRPRKPAGIARTLGMPVGPDVGAIKTGRILITAGTCHFLHQNAWIAKHLHARTMSTYALSTPWEASR